MLFIESEKIASYQDLEYKIKDIQTINYPKYNRKILDIYNMIIKLKDEDLFNFLVQAAEPLLRIDKIENYLRAVVTKKMEGTTGNTRIKGYESLYKLKYSGLEDFNKYVQGYVTNLPYLDVCLLGNTEEIDLSHANFFEANLFKANLSFVDLSQADLSHANLSYASLVNTNLSAANLSQADLSHANLSGANLPYANLSHTVLIETDLQSTNLIKTLIIDPLYYKSSFLYRDNDFKTILNGESVFTNAVTDDTVFIFHIGIFTEYIPEIVNNKKELKLKLEELSYTKDYIESALLFSNLPEN
jgi:Pentapeptide repeats (8 copies)